jgi:hypothetical protein
LRLAQNGPACGHRQQAHVEYVHAFGGLRASWSRNSNSSAAARLA